MIVGRLLLGCRVLRGVDLDCVSSRHVLVYSTYRQTLDEVIAAFEVASAFVYGVFAPDYDFRSICARREFGVP